MSHRMNVLSQNSETGRFALWRTWAANWNWLTGNLHPYGAYGCSTVSPVTISCPGRVLPLAQNQPGRRSCGGFHPPPPGNAVSAAELLIISKDDREAAAMLFYSTRYLIVEAAESIVI